MSNLPESTVYGGPKSKSPWKRVTLRNLNVKYEMKQPITVVTAYDYPSGEQITLFLFTFALPGMFFEDFRQ